MPVTRAIALISLFLRKTEPAQFRIRQTVETQAQAGSILQFLIPADKAVT
jgi:hypothetical protein